MWGLYHQRENRSWTGSFFNYRTEDKWSREEKEVSKTIIITKELMNYYYCWQMANEKQAKWHKEKTENYTLCSIWSKRRRKKKRKNSIRDCFEKKAVVSNQLFSLSCWCLLFLCVLFRVCGDNLLSALLAQFVSSASIGSLNTASFLLLSSFFFSFLLSVCILVIRLPYT